MKKAVLTIAVVLFGLSFTFGTQTTGGPLKSQKELKAKITEKISYPEFALSEKTNCTVWAIVRSEENGQISVVRCDSKNSRMREYVKNELANMNFENSELEKGKEYTVRIDFEYMN